MKSLRRWWKRRYELAGIRARRGELEQELSVVLKRALTLRPAAAKGGYDEIFYAEAGRERVAVVRINSSLKTQSDPIGPKDPGVPLDARERIDREWSAYSLLAEAGLSPEPLWRTDDAMACSWLPWERVSRVLARDRAQFWPLMELIIPLIGQMHLRGVTHLDLNLGNLLVSPDGKRVVVIDFEFGAVDWVSVVQQEAFDYLRVIDDALKKRRGGLLLKENPERLVRLLEDNVATKNGEEELDFVFSKLSRLREEKELCEKLRRVFPKLGEPAC